MPATEQTVTLDCRAVAQRFHEWVLREKAPLRRRPRLATILYSARPNPGSTQYRDLILKDAEKLGIDAESIEVGSEAELLALIARLNQDDGCTGVMIFYPIGGE